MGALPAIEGQDAWERIVNAALEEFSLHGFNGAQIEIIAKKAEVRKQSIYYYFASKEKLYNETIYFFSDRLVVALEAQDFEAMSVVSAFNLYYQMMYDFYADHPLMSKIAIDFTVDQRVAKSGRMTRRVFRIFERLIDRALAEGSLQREIDKATYFSLIAFLICGSFVDPRAAWGLSAADGIASDCVDSPRDTVLQAIRRLLGLAESAAATGQ